MTGAFLHTRSTRAARAAAREILELVGMSGKRDILGGSLTIVDKKRLEIARALATKPKLLMLDECMAGLNQTEIKDVMNLCLKLRENGLSLLIVEHIMERSCRSPTGSWCSTRERRSPRECRRKLQTMTK